METNGLAHAGGQGPLVRLRGISKSFGPTVALYPVDLDINKGDFFALLGPSGCGKTTLLKIIGGFLSPSGGRVEIDGEDVTRLPPERRRTGMVFQGYGLFPHMSVRQNVGYGLKVARRSRDEIDAKVEAMLDLVQLSAMADRMPSALSGGQQQRVALARSLVMEPAVLLLDESLAALDLKLRKAMQEELRALHRSIGGTFVFVTHDQGEAMAMANRVAVMKDGRILQEGTPEEIYSDPRSDFVASFVGDANILEGTRSDGQVSLAAGVSFAAPGPEGPVVAVARPDRIGLSTGAAPKDAEAAFQAVVEDAVFMGTHVRIACRAASGTAVAVHLPPAETARSPVAVGDHVTIFWRSGSVKVLEAGT